MLKNAVSKKKLLNIFFVFILCYSLLVGQVGGGASKVVGLNAAGQARGILQTAAGGTVNKKRKTRYFYVFKE